MSTFFYWQLSTFDDLDRLERLILPGLVNTFNLLHNVVTLQNFTKDNMATIKPPGNRLLVVG